MAPTKTSKGGDDQASGSGRVDFSALIMGFSSAALYYLGEHPVEGKASAQRNLPLARQNIDIIDLLHEKTQGNLTTDEAKLITQVMSDLKVKCLEAQGKA